MTAAYNFIGYWQLFPEKGTCQSGQRLKSGIYKIEAASYKHGECERMGRNGYL